MIDIKDEVAGGVGIHEIKYRHKANFGYWLAKKYRNQGIMTKAVKIVSDFAFKEFKLRRLYANVFLIQRQREF